MDSGDLYDFGLEYLNLMRIAQHGTFIVTIAGMECSVKTVIKHDRLFPFDDLENNIVFEVQKA